MDNFKLKLLSLIGLFAFTISVSGQCDKTGNLFGIPDEFVRNRFKTDKMLYGHPYTTFNKRDYGDAGFNLQTEIEFIKNRIRAEYLSNPSGNIISAYSFILDEADKPRPAEVKPDAPDASISPLAKWAKYNAFVLLIGLDATGIPLDLHKYEQNFANAITHMDYEGADEMGNTIDFANSAMCWIQAYDLYKTYVILNSSTDPAQRKPSDYDRNDGDCSARNKMRQMAKKLYDEGMGGIGSWGTVNHPSGWKKNHGIIAAGTILTCAIVLNDAGPRDIRYRWKPAKWAREANEGIRDCFFTGHHSITRNTPTTSADGKAGYNEGPAYWKYTLQTFAPAMLASNNMYGSTDKDNWYNNKSIQEICKWYEQIRLQDGQLPTFDDTQINTGDNIQALIRGEYDRGGTEGMEHHAPDYIVANCQALRKKPGSINYEKDIESCTKLDASGNLIYRTTDTSNGLHYFHVLYEPDAAVSKQAFTGVPGFGDEGTHDHPDMGAVMLAVDGEWLAIDPPYMGSAVSHYVNKSIHHNKPMILKNDNTVVPFDDGQLLRADETSCKLQLSYHTIPPLCGATLWRNIEVRDTRGMRYYVISDKIDMYDLMNEHIGMVVYFNGNGTTADSEISFLQSASTNSETPDANGRITKWDYPCKKNTDPSKKWALLSHTSALVKNGQEVEVTTYTSDENTIHGSGQSKITKAIGSKPGATGNYGIHTRTIAKQASKQTRFQTILIPYRCGFDVLPEIVKNETATEINTILKFPAPLDTSIVIPGIIPPPPAFVDDTITDFFLSRYEPGTIISINPFNISGSSATLESDAEEIFMSRSTITLIRSGACDKSLIPFKQAKISDGTYLKYDDTTYIQASSPTTLSYLYESKFKYRGYISSATAVSFYLPDMQLGYLMVGKMNGVNQSTTHYPMSTDSFMYITVFFTDSGEFTLELADPCAADCYFPSTLETIDSPVRANVTLVRIRIPTVYLKGKTLRGLPQMLN